MTDGQQGELFALLTLAPPGSAWHRAQHESVLPNRAKLIARFLRFLPEHRPRGRCWFWQGADDENGYGQFRCFGGVRSASRVAFILFKGPPGDLRVCHTCDSPPCCNPAHLFLGSVSDNAQDAVAKGRWKSRGPFGVFNRDAVRVVRVFGRTRLGRRILARHFRVLPYTILRVAMHRTYSRHPDLIGPPRVTKKLAVALHKGTGDSRAASERVSSEATLPLLAFVAEASQPIQMPS